ncbi:MAG: lipoprotein signal peptidase [Saprospiraceae bacterium]|nr:lipoprotein signal peptidase [Saprospiraceae bacterium]
MTHSRKALIIVVATVLVVLVIDQASKIWVKTTMEYGEEFLILGLDWARIHFVENEGMAFGISFGEQTGKLLLSLFRLVAVGFIVYMIYQMIRNKESLGVLICFSLIFAGAMGNIIDSAVYGLIFSPTPYHGGVAEIFPEEGGYAGFLYGKVVDMFYFPIIQSRWPEWLPIWGGQRFEFFSPVFNVADSAITCGIIALLLFYRPFFMSDNKTSENSTSKPGIQGHAEAST